jgi:hypothetical protein
MIDADVYAFVDHSDKKAEICAILCDYISDINVVTRPYKYGCRKNILNGVSEIFNKKYDAVIVLEDDLILSKEFLLEMNYLLGHTNKNIGSVTGHKIRNYLRPCSIGWGTWRSIWLRFEKEWRMYPLLKKEGLGFAKIGGDLPIMYEKTRRGLLDSWAISWAYFHFKYNLICRCSGHNHVTHIGRNGTHFRWYSVFGIRQYFRKFIKP